MKEVSTRSRHPRNWARGPAIEGHARAKDGYQRRQRGFACPGSSTMPDRARACLHAAASGLVGTSMSLWHGPGWDRVVPSPAACVAGRGAKRRRRARATDAASPARITRVCAAALLRCQRRRLVKPNEQLSGAAISRPHLQLQQQRQARPCRLPASARRPSPPPALRPLPPPRPIMPPFPHPSPPQPTKAEIEAAKAEIVDEVVDKIVSSVSGGRDPTHAAGARRCTAEPCHCSGRGGRRL